MNRQTKNEQLIEDLRSECQGYLLEIAKKDSEIALLHAHIEEQRIQLASITGGKAAMRQAYNSVDNFIMNTINTRGAVAQKNTKKKHPSLRISSNDVDTVLSEIKEYDIREFFLYKGRSQKSHLKPHYRIAAKLYRTTRDTGHAVASKTYRSVRRLKK